MPALSSACPSTSPGWRPTVAGLPMGLVQRRFRADGPDPNKHPGTTRLSEHIRAAGFSSSTVDLCFVVHLLD